MAVAGPPATANTELLDVPRRSCRLVDELVRLELRTAEETEVPAVPGRLEAADMMPVMPPMVM